MTAADLRRNALGSVQPGKHVIATPEGEPEVVRTVKQEIEGDEENLGVSGKASCIGLCRNGGLLLLTL